MTREVIATCPVCEGELQVTHLRCTTCGTGLEGQFSVGRFGRLTREQMFLLESFLRARGNLRDMERELGISYPTVRNRVEALVRALGLAEIEAGDPSVDGLAVAPPAASVASVAADRIAAERRRVLDRLAAHEIDAEDAARALRDLSRTAAPDA